MLAFLAIGGVGGVVVQAATDDAADCFVFSKTSSGKKEVQVV